MSSTPETATGLSASGDDSAVPLLANRSSVPGPDDEKLSLTGVLPLKAGVSAVLTAPAVMAPGVMAWPIDRAAFAPLIVTGRPSPSVISLIRVGSGPDRFSIATV